MRRKGISFNNRVSVSPNQNATNVIQNASPGTLLEFDSGTYQLNGITGIRSDNVGLRGTGDVKFKPPNGFNKPLINAQGVDNVLIENIDIDITANDTTAGIKCLAPSFHIEGIKFHGRGAHSDWHGGDVANAFLVGVTDPNGTGTMKNIVHRKGSVIGHYGGGRVGIWVGWGHQGTLKVKNVDLREFGNNGMYSGRNRGNVQVENSFFQNNNVSCGPRISGQGSYVENCEIEVDMSKYTGPNDSQNRSFNPRGIIIEQGRNVRMGREKTPGAEIRNCDFKIEQAPPRTQGAIHVGGTGRTLTVKNTRVEVNQDGVEAVFRKRPGAGSNPASSPPHWIKLENCHISGSSSGGPAVGIHHANGSEVRDCEIKMPNKDIGVGMWGTANGVVADTNIDVGGGRKVRGADSRRVGGNASPERPNISGPTGLGGVGTSSVSMSMPSLDRKTLLALAGAGVGYLGMKRRK